jgi:hypothetical protein
VFGGPNVEAAAKFGVPGVPVSAKVGGWAFGGGYAQIGVSNIGTPQATFDGGVGVIGGGGLLAGADVKGTDYEVEGGLLTETGMNLFSVPLGSGTTLGQGTFQLTPATTNKYLGVVIGNTEIGGLGSCDSSSCNATIIYGKSTPPLWNGPVGPINGKFNLWGGGGLSFTWPSSWWRPSWL